MSQKLQKISCPGCNSPIHFPDDREYTFCQYCGCQVYKEDSHFERKLDHEEVKMEYVDRHDERIHVEKRDKMTIITTVIVLGFFFILIFFFFGMIIYGNQMIGH